MAAGTEGAEANDDTREEMALTIMDEEREDESRAESASLDPGQGDGGELSRGDLDHLRQAASHGWHVPDDTRRELVRRLQSIVANPSTSTRTLLSVARVLHAFNGQDIEAGTPAAPAVAVQVNVIEGFSDGEQQQLASTARLLMSKARATAASATETQG